MRTSAPTVNGQLIVQPEQKFFLSPKAENLKHAALRKSLRFGEVSIMILAARNRHSVKREHFGLAGFHLN
jgi:hypothetical protein